MLFADRVYKHCFYDGALTDGNSQQRWNDIAGYVDESLICEKARWGDSEDAVYVDMTGNADIFIAALRDWSDASYPGVKLYPDIDPTQFSQRGGEVVSGYSLNLTNPNASGTIYYTLDGSDPREAVTGAIDGVEYTGPITINSAMTVKTRVYDSGEWSALDQADFTIIP
jgi:hypothetical protein